MSRQGRPQDDVALRLAGAGAVGALVFPAAALAVVGAMFGGLAIGAAVLGAAVGVAALALVALHRTTAGAAAPRPTRSDSIGWGLGVTIGGLLLVAAGAGMWEASGRDFGREPALWWLLSGTAFALVAALSGRRTRVPAVALLLALLGWAVALQGLDPPTVSGTGAGAPRG